ncbi:MAG TPA: hypothetical protein VES42_14205 [Pilimelia sp.]|nr:hypothetical protein [Pilimelia sp.]
MKNRRLATAGLGLVTALTLMVTGCGEKDGTDTGNQAGAGTTSQAADKDPAAELAAAALELGKTSMRTEMKMGTVMTVTGVADGPSKTAEFTSTITNEGRKVKVDLKVIGDDTYTRMDAGGEAVPGMDGKTWRHASRSSDPNTAAAGDPTAYARLMETSADVQKVGDNDFKGTIDFTKAAEKGLGGIDKKQVNALGAQMKAVPFTATVDGEGRLTRLTMTMPAMAGQPPQPMDVRYSDFGVKVDVQKPPAGQIQS